MSEEENEDDDEDDLKVFCIGVLALLCLCCLFGFFGLGLFGQLTFMGESLAQQGLDGARRRSGLPVAGAVDDLAHATEPDAGLAMASAVGGFGAMGLRGSVQAQVELSGVRAVRGPSFAKATEGRRGGFICYSFHNFLISSYRGGWDKFGCTLEDSYSVLIRKCERRK
jgi:hypothetical protein